MGKQRRRTWAWGPHTVQARTKSEARAILKNRLGVKRLPVGAKLAEVIHAAGDQDDVISIPADVEILAAEATGEGKGPRKFKVLAYTGGALLVDRYDLPIAIDLAGMSFANAITANLDHDQKQRVGHVTDRNNDGRRVTLEGVVSATGPAAVEFEGSAANDYPWKASVEAHPQRNKVDYVSDGETVTVNGQKLTGPLYVARKSTLHGIAFLSRGADEKTKVSIAASAANPQKETEMEFGKWIEAMGFEPDKLTDQQRAALQAKYDAEIKAAPKDGGDKKDKKDGDPPPIIAAPAFDLDDIKAAFSEHQANLEVSFAKHEDDVEKKQFAEIKAKAMKDARELKVQAIEEKWVAGRYEIEAIKAASAVELELVRAERPQGPAIHGSSRDVGPNVIEAALCQSLALPDIEKQYDEQTLDAAQAYRGLGLQEAIIMAAVAGGYSGRMAIRRGNLREVMQYAFPPIHAAGPSTMSLSGILSAVANNELLAGYEEIDQTWRKIAAIRSVNNFHQVTSYRLLDDMEYEEVKPSGEIAQGQLSDESYTRQARTYAKMFSLSRTDIINDDLGAMEDLRNRIGKGAGMKMNRVFWTAFLDNASFFTADRGNYISGATTVLDSAGLALGVKAFRTRKSTEEKRVGGKPQLLLIPPELEVDADELYVSRNINAGSSAKTKQPSSNTHYNKYEPVVSDWLSDSSISGYSATAWYLLMNPALLAAMVVSFLYGEENPTVESSDADFSTLGVDFRGYHDFGCDQAEYLAGVKSKGAA